jgi:copper(I)-binding protein
MLPVDIVEIPAGATVAFEPGGLHVMFMGVAGAALREGGHLTATLEFERAGEVEVTFNVEARTGGPDHGEHATPTH